jgi:hypothetical protein
MAPYRYAISLRITHPSIDPAEITVELGEDPSNWQKAGSPSPHSERESARHCQPDDTFWVGFSSEGESQDHDLQAGLQALLSRLQSHRGFFHRLREDGGEAEFFVGWFLGKQGGEILSHELMAQLADLKIDLSFDLYLGEDDTSPE